MEDLARKMQFNVNSDFPAHNLPKEQWHIVARPPFPFGEAKFTPCVCITTRVLVNISMAAGLGNDYLTDEGLQQNIVILHGMSYLVQTVRGVVVKTPSSLQHGGGGVWSDSSDSSVDSCRCTPQAPQQPPQGNFAGLQPVVEKAYWLRRTIRAAIYGQVRFGIVLRKLNPPVQLLLPGASSPTDFVKVEWEATAEQAAVKEMRWDQIQTEGHRLAEDPVKEIAAMQHLENWLAGENAHEQHLLQQQNLLNLNAQLNNMNVAHQSFNSSGHTSIGNPVNPQQYDPNYPFNIPPPRPRPRNMAEAHVMTALDALTDGRNLYLMMPYCNGGELFDLLEKRTKFPEREARFWFRQILEGLTTLKAAGISHRDLSLENLMIHGNNALIIDMGMCLRVPCDATTGQRFLITPQGICGKWHCMSPEICNNMAFDGYAVDLWAAGVILFIMLMGYPPWEKPLMSDERFKFMTQGYLVHMLTEWKTGLSGDAMDLLQRMFWLDPADRLSLDQVWAHPWTKKSD